MTDQRTPPPGGRRRSRRRFRPRAGQDARPATVAPREAGAETTEATDRGAEQPVRPWDVGGRDAPEGEQPRRRRRRTVASLLADVPEDAVIATRRLTKEYGSITAVDNLDLTIRAGEVFGLLGPNGAGKTTTVLMLLGLTEPTRGVVRVLGHDPTREPLAIKRMVGYLPDNVGFYGGMSGRENLRYTARLNGLGRAEADARINQLLAEVRLEEAADRNAGDYSRGMRQRLGIADALVKDPSVLILDEPTIAIDPAGVEELLALLRRLVKDRNLTVLLSSHILGQVQSLCDQVGFFSVGRMVAAGPLDELARGTDAMQQTELEVGVEGDPAAIDAIAVNVPGVESVTAHERDEHLRLVTASSDVAAPLAAALAAANVPLVHLRRRGSDLLELYRRYVPEGIDGSIR